MPVYNGEAFLREAIDSILNQTYQNFELIIVNDGSTDYTYNIITSYQEPRIKLINLAENSGVRKATNIAIRESRGEFLARADADDVSVNDRIETQVKFLLENEDIGVCGGLLQLFGYEELVWKYPLNDNKIKASLFWGVAIAQPSSMIRKKILIENEILYNESGESFAEDWEFFHDLIAFTKFSNLNKILVNYRRDNSSLTSCYRSKSKLLNSLMFEKVLEKFNYNYSAKDVICFLFLNGQEKVNHISELKEIKKWLNDLIEHNNEFEKYPLKEFKESCLDKWERLFYRICDRGVLLTFVYWMLSFKITFSQLKYFLAIHLSFQSLKKDINAANR
jgi:glycosyltransferase involved in cell wall biosynthesis